MLVRSYSFILVACFMWSLNPVANKVALVDIAVPQLVLMRAIISAIILLIISLLLGHHFNPKQIGWRPFVLGILDPGLTSLLFVTSLTVIRDSNVLIHSTLDGHGIALCAVGIVQEYLDSGRLIRPFELSITAGGFYYLVYPDKALRKPLVSLFKTWLVKEVRKSESR